ncbi:MAG: threonine--tRNA ligase, partial [Lachnospiraceae bacterium]|nr:threonine--tRNA ligase [Lachnospiraceae bacterium]
QIETEIADIIAIADEIYGTFGLTYRAEFSTRPDDFMGDIEVWNRAEAALKKILDDKYGEGGYEVNEGDGAFYGPKIDFHLEDCLGRSWQCGTIQLDFQLPQRFELEYMGEDGHKHRPIMIHRVVFGSIERFIGILTEHFGGAFPTWLAPVQVKVLPISDKYAEYAGKVGEMLDEAGIRTEVDLRAETIGYKIREAQMQKIPYMLVVGQKEEEARLVSVRSRFAGDEGQMTLGDFLHAVRQEIQEKVIREVKAE